MSNASVDGDDKITGLKPEEIHGIQLIYTVDVTKPTFTKEVKVFAARDAYVWPSDRPAGNGERVGTFPLNYPLTRTASGTYEYRYRICEDTFASLDRGTQSQWVTLIDHAFMQWQLATDGLVRMVEEAGDCADYSPFVTHVVSEITPMLPATSSADRDRIAGHVTAMVIAFRTVGLIDLVNFERHSLAQPIQDDISRNEIIMVDDTNLAIDFITTRVLTEFSKDLGFAQCDGGCANRSDYNGGSTTDIFLKRNTHDKMADGDLIIQTGNEEIVFNTCPNMGGNYNYPYSSLVHEAGHAVGIREGRDGTGQEAHHSNENIKSAIMSYGKDVPKCSPHPLDIMAIYAIYQSGP